MFLRAISPEALTLAMRLANERGWKPTDTFTAIEPDRAPRSTIAPVGFKTAQDADIDLAGLGRVLVWDWSTGDPYVVAGTMIVDTWNPSTSTTFQAEYWAGDDWGYARWARFLEGRDRDGHVTREASARTTVGASGFGVMKAGWLGLQQSCAEQRRDWRNCMHECVRDRLQSALYSAVQSGLGPSRRCAEGDGRYVGFGSFIACMVKDVFGDGASALWEQFGPRPACDSNSFCGAAPSCR
jgi:hypothetical protein